MQKTRTFTGINGINTQDYATQEGRGPIADRSQEHLGGSDRAIVVLRRLLLEATNAVANGKLPRGADPLARRAIRPYDAVVPPGQHWQEAFAEELKAKW